MPNNDGSFEPFDSFGVDDIELKRQVASDK
jgi:hypothetical protein